MSRRRTLSIKQLKFVNPYKRLRTAVPKAMAKIVQMEARFVWTRARSLMRKAPKNPKTQHGHYQPYKTKSYEKRVNKYRAQGGKRPGRGFYRKGLYSAPGRPPFWHEENKSFNLRTFWYGVISNPKIPHKSGGDVYAQRVGPKFKHQKGSTPIPELMEQGGVVRLNKKGSTYKTRNSNIRLRRQDSSKAVYAPRPYMKPAGIEARESAAKKSPYTLKKITQIAGIVGGKRTY